MTAPLPEQVMRAYLEADKDRTAILRASAALMAAACRHYFVKQGGVWTCTMCGETR